MSTITITRQPSEEEAVSVTELCPFGAIVYENGMLDINAACRMCRQCVKKRPDLFAMEDERRIHTDISDWKGIAVYADHDKEVIHPVTYELLGKARQMANRIGQKVSVVLIGSSMEESARAILAYGADEVHLYDDRAYEHFTVEPYAAAMEDFIRHRKPGIFLVGGTTIGRSLAPRVAARFRTGLTADCTVLDVRENGELDQIRPAFGGNIMAHIHTPDNRPQFAAVRYRMFDKLEMVSHPTGRIIACSVAKERLLSHIRVLDVHAKPPVKGIEDAELVVVAGRGIKKEGDLAMVRDLAKALGAELASTRPLIEAGWVDPRRQIGLSGRTVKPRLIITCGVSGSVQFVAGMQHSDTIVAINSDREAPIFSVAHYCLVGDLYGIVPLLTEAIVAKEVPPCSAQ